MDKRVKDLLEKVKITAGAAVEAAGKAAESAGKKAGEVVENTKLSLKIFDLNSEIEIAYKEIGRLVYMTHAGLEADAEELEQILARIDEKNAQIAALKAKQTETKTTVVCVNCGKTCDKNDSFCRYCGEQF